jgi:hypothetical protein
MMRNRPQRIDVPRYHFDLIDSQIISDEGGAELPDNASAIQAAHLLAKRLVQEKPELLHRGFAIRVTDEDGRELSRVPIDPVH